MTHAWRCDKRMTLLDNFMALLESQMTPLMAVPVEARDVAATVVAAARRGPAAERELQQCRAPRPSALRLPAA